MNLKELLIYGKNYLKEKNIQDYDLISKILAQYITAIDKNTFIIHFEQNIEKSKFQNYKEMLEKIADGTPIQYIINTQEFMKLNFYVDENVLIPQPDTEIIVQEIIENYKKFDCKILDLCTGSGAIGISLAKYIESAKVTASDISLKAMQIAKLNAEKNLVHKKMTFVESNMFENIYENEFDVIVSNPPYIETSLIEHLDKQVKSEPILALDGGEDGLYFYKIIAEKAHDYLKHGGKIFLEIGYNQREAVIDILTNTKKYKDIYSKKDFGGNDRLIVATVRR